MTGRPFNRVFRLLIVLNLILAGIANTSVTVFAQAGPGPLRVVRTSAENRFPDGVFVSLEAESSAGNIASVHLLTRFSGDEKAQMTAFKFKPGPHVSVSTEELIPWEPGAALEYYWEIKDTAGNILRTEPAVVNYDDLRFQWQHIGNDGLTFYWHRGSKPWAQEIYKYLEQTMRTVERDLQVTLRAPVRVWAYDSLEDFRSAHEHVEEWAIGTATPEAGVIRVYLPTSADPFAARMMMAHEIAHFYFYEKTDNPAVSVPTWLNEGVAVYYEPRSHAWEDRLVRTAVRNKKLPALATLRGSFPADSDGADLAYATSYAVVKYIVKTYGTRGLAKLLSTYKEAPSGVRIFPRAFGISLEQFEQAWRKSLGAGK